MFVGHLGAGLMMKATDRRVNLGLLFFAAMLLDLLLGLFTLAGLETMIVPPDFAVRHYLQFIFPYSHGLAASLLWSLLAFGITWAATKAWRIHRGRAAMVVAGAVFSHFFLDALVHVPELPLLDAHSYKLGLGLWNHMGIALTLELLIAAAGLYFYFRGATGRRARHITLMVTLWVAATLTVMGGAVGTKSPDPNGAVASWLIVPCLLLGLGWWIERVPPAAEIAVTRKA